MKKINYLFLAVITLITSCAKDTTGPESLQLSSLDLRGNHELNLNVLGDGIKIVDNLIEFENRSTLYSLINSYENQTDQLREKLSSVGFISYDSDTSENHNSYQIYDPILKLLANSDASIAVEDTIIFMRKGVDYSISKEDFRNNRLSIVDTNDAKFNKFFVYTHSELHSADEPSFDKDKVGAKQISIANNLIVGSDQEQIYTPEEHHGRPERIKFETYSQTRQIGNTSGIRIIGEAYRRGGVFGRRTWRNDECFWSRFHGSWSTELTGGHSFDTGLIWNREEYTHVLARIQNGLRDGIRDINVTLEAQKNSNSSRYYTVFISNFGTPGSYWENWHYRIDW